MSAQTPFLVFSGTNSRYLAEKICNSLGCPLGQMNIQHFADGEFSVSYEESIRGRDVFLVQSTFPNADNLMELLLMIDAPNVLLLIQSLQLSLTSVGHVKTERINHVWLSVQN